MYAPALIILIIVIVYYAGRDGLVDVKDNSDGSTYRVVAEFKDRVAAANRLGRVNQKLAGFFVYLKSKYHLGTNSTEDGRQETRPPDDIIRIIESMIRGYRPDRIFETNPRYTSDTSYTINKGEKMYICLRDKNAPWSFVDDNTLMFVVLHELSHIGCYDAYGHPDRFWDVFRFVLSEAVASGLYKSVNYASNPIDYCGLNINYNPLYDPTLARLGNSS